MVVALIALFVALGGAGYAALKVPKKSVGTKQLKNGAVTEAKLKKNAVGTKRIKKGAVTAEKIAAGVISTDAATLGGFAANDLVRSAVATSNSTTTKTGQGTVLTTQITAPGNGFLIVNASSDISSTADQFAQCALQIDEAGVAGGTRDISLQAGTDDIDQICSTGSTQAVATGVHKVDLESQGADADVTYGRSSLQVLFVPFGANGT